MLYVADMIRSRSIGLHFDTKSRNLKVDFTTTQFSQLFGSKDGCDGVKENMAT